MGYKLVRYDGETTPRLATGRAPVDAEGKPKKVVAKRDAKPHEELAITRRLWAQANRQRRATRGGL